MKIPVPPRRQSTTIFVTACAAFALLSLSCGGGSPQAASLSGTGTTSTVSLSATSLSFGNQSVDTTSTAQTATLTNTGAGALSISLTFTGINASDFGETDTCGNFVAAGAQCMIAVMFTPSGGGVRTATLSIASNATGNAATASLSGTGTHDVILSWTASATAGVIGYNIYRGTTPGGEGPTPLNSTPISDITYIDENVAAGATFYYVITAVAADGVTESADSNEVSATVPSP
jgi:hypothetical protein